jgi:hypothetical protein
MRVAAIAWCTEIAGLQVYLFRRIYEDLIKNHMAGPSGFRALLAGWQNAGWCTIVDDEIRFFNGSTIYLCHCQHEEMMWRYQGAEMHVLLIDELTHFTERIYRFLRNRVRMIGLTIPARHVGMFPRVLASANPGNIGHLWVKNTWIANVAPFVSRRMPASEGGMLRQYIPARLDDNPSMAKDDPGYEHRLEGLGSKTLVAAMRWGDWDVVEGAFFDCWSNESHVIPPFAIPRHWLRFRSMDWGSASPFSIGWWAVVQDDCWLGIEDGTARLQGSSDRGWSDIASDGPLSEIAGVPWDDRIGRPGADRGLPRYGATAANAWGDGYVPAGQAAEVVPDEPAGEDQLGLGASEARRKLLPRGALIRYREDYGDQDGTTAKGLKLDAEQVAERIKKREQGDPKLGYGVLDPRCFAVESGPSIAERMNVVLIKHRLAAWRKADNRRVNLRMSRDSGGPMSGWDQMRSRMIGMKVNGRMVSMIYCFSTCGDSIRTIPILQHDAHRAEDMDTTGEDHAADEWRYACMSRPWLKTKPERAIPRDGYSDPQEEVVNDRFMTL